MDKLSYVVDARLGAIQLDKMYLARNRILAGKAVSGTNPSTSDRPLLVGAQQLEANVLYPSSSNPNVRYYLPLYKLAVNGDKPDVELHYNGADNGDVGQLTIGLTWDPPAAPSGVELRVMDHHADLELRFLIPVDGKAGSAGQDSVPLQPFEREAGNRMRSVTLFTDKAEFDSVYQSMSNENRQAALHLKMTARVGVKTWRQVVVGGSLSKQQQLETLRQRGALLTRVINPEALAAAPKADASRVRVVMKPVQEDEQERLSAARTIISRPGPVSRPPIVRMPVPALRMTRVLPATRPAAAQPAAGTILSAAAAQPAFRMAAFAAARRLPVSAATLSRVNMPPLQKAVAVTDLKIGNLKALPILIALGANGEPAIIDTELESQQSLAFYFKPDANRGVFATEGFDPGAPHLLLALLLTVNGRSCVVYQDNLMREVVHVAPAQFRLVRDQEAPYLPGISFLPADFGTTGDKDDEAEVLFQMVMNYRLEPWIDPDTIEAARAELAKQGLAARFTPILPREAQLSLDLDALGAEQQRDKASVEPAAGITDTLVLDQDVFTRIWRERLAQPGVGIGGKVRYKLFDGTDAESAVMVSFWETSAAAVFDVDFIGSAGQPDRYRVNVRNKIESPVSIEKLPGVTLGPGAVASPVDAGAALNRKLQPQQSIQIDYQVTPPGTPVTSIAPLVLGTVEPNLNTLLKVLMLSPGYKSMSFTVPVSAAPNVFGAAQQGSEPLIGLLVEFDDGTRAELTAEAPSSDVTLTGRLVDQILGKADDQHRYLYRVTNLHPSGEGARSSWRDGQGSAQLVVGAAVVNLDF